MSLFVRSVRTAWLAAAVSLLALSAPSSARANGLYSHVHMSQLAAEHLPPGELRDLFDDASFVLAFENGSMLPDSGYAAGDDYGEFAHWSTFRLAYIDYIKETYGPDFASAEARQHIGVLFGAASHGIADQSYDTTLLARTFELDGEDPDVVADQYADYFIVIDNEIVFAVEADAPYTSLGEVMTAASGREVTSAIIMEGMDLAARVTRIQSDPALSRALYWNAWQAYPFLGTHVYNEAAPGSLPYMGVVIAKHWQVMWRRLHDTDDVDTDLVIHTLPEDGGVNFPVSVDDAGAYGRVGIWFGYPFDRDVVGEMPTLRDAAGTAIETTHHAAYNGRRRSFLQLEPTAKLAYDTDHIVEVPAGFPTLDGRTSTAAYSFSFRTQCGPDDLDSCPPYEPLMTGDVPVRGGGRDAGPTADASVDAGVEAGVDASSDGGAEDAGEETGSGGCAVNGGEPSPVPLASLLLVALVIGRRRFRVVG